VKKEKTITFILVVLLLVLASALRLYRPYAIPFSYDELGSILKTYHNGFKELVDYMMHYDTHPVGVEVFLFYWTKLVGYTPLYVKLPFIISGIFSVLYIFRIGKEWFNPTVGLICAAYVATLQYTIMHSQEIRLYGIGLFFALAMAYHWGRIMFFPEKRFDLNWLLYVLFSALCAYTHYFCLLAAGIAGLTGLFFIKKRYVIRYVTAGIMIFVLYIPHLHILFYQWALGNNLGAWLGKPRNTYILEYLNYVFHFSPYAYGCAAALCLWGIIYSIVKKTFKWRVMLISFLWFAVPFCLGFFYSVYLNPILQYRVLIFSFPFLLLSIFGMMPDINGILKTLVVAAICTVNIYTLVFERKYYDFYYSEPIRKVCLLNDSVTKTLGKAGTLRFVEGDTGSLTNIRELYYIRRYKLDSTYLPLDNSPDKTSLVDYLEENPRKDLTYGCLNEADVNYLPIFLNYYPYIIKQYNLWGGNFYIFTNQKGNNTSPVEFNSKQDFEGSNLKGWQAGDDKCILDTIHFSGRHCYNMDSLHEYGPAFTYNLKDMIGKKNDIIVATAEIYPLSVNMDKVVLVATLESKGKTICWSGESLSNYIEKGEKGKWIKVYHTIKLSDNYINYPDIQVKIYLWNQSKRNFFVDDFEAGAIKGNPFLYGITEPF
jgi:hypothetical protein